MKNESLLHFQLFHLKLLIVLCGRAKKSGAKEASINCFHKHIGTEKKTRLKVKNVFKKI